MKRLFKKLFNNKGFCGGGATPTLPKMPAPSPMPMPTSAMSLQTEDERARKIGNLKKGILSTIKTSPQGAIGKGPELSAPAGQGVKTALGS